MSTAGTTTALPTRGSGRSAMPFTSSQYSGAATSACIEGRILDSLQLLLTKPPVVLRSYSCRIITSHWSLGCCGNVFHRVSSSRSGTFRGLYPRVFRTCPWARHLLDGLLGRNIMGLQTSEDCTNFLESVESILDAEVDRLHNVVRYRGHSTTVRAYPVGVEWANRVLRKTPPSKECRERLCRDLKVPPGVRLGVGIDQLDYTKGINEKFLAIERLLESHTDFRGQFVFVQVAEPSRDSLPAYRNARAQLLETCERVNTTGRSSYSKHIMRRPTFTRPNPTGGRRTTRLVPVARC